MKPYLKVGSSILAGLAIIILYSALYTVNEVEQVVITQFGKPVGEPIREAGIQLKVPFIQHINSIDKRVLEWEGTPSDMPTKDKLYISVSLYGRWQVTDPLQYFLRLGDERSAQSRLDDIFERGLTRGSQNR
jgi:membrane protease subunit HflC